MSKALGSSPRKEREGTEREAKRESEGERIVSPYDVCSDTARQNWKFY
jgi:hypothetical protein